MLTPHDFPAARSCLRSEIEGKAALPVEEEGPGMREHI
jgi:hypothetical protein